MALAEQGLVNVQTEIQRLVGEAEAGGAPDAYAGKREHPRFAEGMQLEITTDPSRPGGAWPVTMHNVSESGFAFRSRQNLCAGQTIYVREFNPDAPPPWLRARVRHRTQSLQGFLFGASFEIEVCDGEDTADPHGMPSVAARLPRPV